MEKFFNLDSIMKSGVEPAFVVAQLRGVIKAGYQVMMPGLDSVSLDGVSLMSAQKMEQYIAQAIMVKNAPMVAGDLVSIASGGAGPWADTIKYTIVEDTGIAAWIVSADMPWADTHETEETRRVHTMGAKVGWKMQEIEAVRAGGGDLSTSKLRSQRAAVDRARNEVFLRGDALLPESGLISTGIINDPSVPITPAPNGVFSGRTGLQLIQDVLDLVATHKAGTKRTRIPDTLALPTAQFHLFLQPLGSGSDTSPRDYILKNIPEITKIIEINELAGAGVGGADRAILYDSSDEVAEGILPLSFRIIQPQLVGLSTVVHAIERNGGITMKFPPGYLYVDGV